MRCNRGLSLWPAMRCRMENETVPMTKISGRSLIGSHEAAGAGEAMYATDPATGQRLQPEFISATTEEVERAVRLAAEAFEVSGRVSGRDRAAFLRTIAVKIESDASAIIDRASQ